MSSVDLLLLDPAHLEGAGEGWLPLLDPLENVRWARFRHPLDRRAFAAAHGLLRQGLSARVPQVAPADWRFTTTASGKPGLQGSPLRFNLTHCRELVAVILAEGLEVGVDVEPVDLRHATDAVAARVYGPLELADLAAQPDAARRVERFFERWTVKEAWVKATGEGISEALPGFEVELSAGRGRVLRGDHRPWHLQWWTPVPGIKLAACAGTSEPLQLEPRWWPV